jgi:D-3-phosphoglycerate dehydrogenase
MKVLVTCPPMLGMLDQFAGTAERNGLQLNGVQTTQVLSEEELISLLPDYDGWIIGDDPATRRVFEAGKQGRLKAAVKWGIGTDNVDFDACEDLGIPITNTPQMFGSEVADLAIGYLVGLARQSFLIDREIRARNSWPKPAGVSLNGKRVGIVGFGDIGYATAKRLVGFDMYATAYDPVVEGNKGLDFVRRADWPDGLETLDFLVFTCSLNAENHHMLNEHTIHILKPGAFVINVARGPLIDELALINALESGQIGAAALDVFEKEPLPADSALRKMPQCIFGSHNGSNTVEAVTRASHEAIRKLSEFLRDY